MSLIKKWSSLPILHFAIFHHYCHETGHSGFTLQPNKNLSKVKEASFLHLGITVYIISVHRHSQQLWEANQASASNPLGHLPPPKWGWDDEEKNQDGIPHHAANIQALAGWEELVTHRQPDASAVTWSKSDSGLREHSSPTARQFASQTQLRPLKHLMWMWVKSWKQLHFTWSKSIFALWIFM